MRPRPRRPNMKECLHIMAYPCNLIIPTRIVRRPLGMIVLLLICLGTPCAAQVSTDIVSDGPTGTTVQLGNPTTHLIEGGDQQGANLFHSFDRFHLGTNETASFVGLASGIEHIISRVTGNEASMLDGTLHSAMPAANLFFMNPNGVVFGANARLDVNGSFYLSTANTLQFADGTRLDTDPNQVPGFTAAAPVAFGFMTPEVAPISIEGS